MGKMTAERISATMRVVALALVLPVPLLLGLGVAVPLAVLPIVLASILALVANWVTAQTEPLTEDASEASSQV
ncbi:hypothetical protein [Plantibacter sp. ME-Dv--P-095]|uniref:hypothetical protein n=1 Tax=Plantibacter sp. ME-Dv--P-095 TaxID=3040299 RepID=UPI00254D2EA5|nr:hypothetical protein [Plantibacter sp. ME-Dv--P-095]